MERLRIKLNPYDLVMAINTPPYKLVSLYHTDPQIHNLLYDDEGFWKAKLDIDFPNTMDYGIISYKELYIDCVYRHFR